MSKTTLVREFLRGVCEDLQDINPQYKRWTEIDLVKRLNYGQMAIAKYLPQAGSRVDVVKLVPGTRQYLGTVLAANIKPGDGSTGVDTYGISLLTVTRNMGTDGLTPGRAVRAGTREAMDALETSASPWHAATGQTAIREFMADPDTPLVFYTNPPVHSSTAVWAEVSWMAEPARVPAGGAPGAEIYALGGGSTALLGVPDQFVDDLHAYVVAAMLMKGSKNTSNIPKAGEYMNRFVTSINAQAVVLGGVSPRLKTLPFITQLQQEEGS